MRTAHDGNLPSADGHTACADYYPYSGPKLAQARKSAPSRSAVPKAFHALGRKTSASGTLCMHTGILSIEAKRDQFGADVAVAEGPVVGAPGVHHRVAVA